MSAPTSGSSGSEPAAAPVPGYYPDPSIPGYIRYWNGSAWVPGTSRRAPTDGSAPEPPDGPSAQSGPSAAAPLPDRPAPAVDESGPMFLDEDPAAPRVEHGPGPSVPDPRAPLAQDDVPAWPEPRPAEPELPRISWGAQSARVEQGPASGEQGAAAADPYAAAPYAGAAPAHPAAEGSAAGSGEFGAQGPAELQGPPPQRALPGTTPRSGPTSDAGPNFGVPQGVPPQSPPSGPAGGAAAPGGSGGYGHPGAQGPAGAGGYGHPGAQGVAGGVSAEGPAEFGAGPNFGVPQGVPVQSAPSGPAGGGASPGGSGGYGYPGPQGAAGAGGYGYPGPQAAPGPAGGPAAPGRPGGYGYPGQQGFGGGAPAGGPAGSPASPGGYGYPGPQNLAGGASTAGPAAGTPNGPAAQSPAAGGILGTPSGPGAQNPGGPGGPGASVPWTAQVQDLARAEGVVPWRPPVDDPFGAARAPERPAGLVRRFVARLIDTVLVGALTALAAVPLGTAAYHHAKDKVDQAKLTGETVRVWLIDSTTGAQLGGVLAVFVIVCLLLEVLPTARWGRTAGKRLVGLQVLDIEGQLPPGFGASLRRWLTRTVLDLVVVGVVGVAWCLFDRPWKQCWHDKAARTFVAGS